ncbi:MAG: energy transducer TonB [Gammaproteobacteria bacterium]
MADGRFEEYKITDDTPKVLREIFRGHLAQMKFSPDELEFMPASPAMAVLTAYYRFTNKSNGDIAVQLDDKKLRFVREDVRGEANEDTDVVSIVRINPRYPAEALNQGIEGWVETEFTITEDGLVEDIVVVHSSHKRLVRKEAVRAIKKWKFRPRTIDGQPVARRGQQVVEFSMESAE